MMEVKNRPLLLPRDLVARAGLGAVAQVAPQDVDVALRSARQGTDQFAALHQMRRLLVEDAGGKSLLVASPQHEKDLTASLRQDPAAAIAILGAVGRSQQPAADAVVALGFLERQGGADLIKQAWQELTLEKGFSFPSSAAPLVHSLVQRLLTSPDTSADRLANLASQVDLIRAGTPQAKAFGVGVLSRHADQQQRTDNPATPWWQFPAVGTQKSRDVFVDRLVSVANETLAGKLGTRGELLPLQGAIEDLATIGTPRATAALTELAGKLLEAGKLGALESGGTAALWMGVAAEVARAGNPAALAVFARGVDAARGQRSAIEFGPFQNLVGLNAGLRALAEGVVDKPEVAGQVRALLDKLVGASGNGQAGAARDLGRLQAAPYFVDTPAHAIQLARAYLAVGDKETATSLAKHAASQSLGHINQGGQPPYQPEVAPALTDALALLRELGVRPGDSAPTQQGSSTWQRALQAALPRLDGLRREGTNDAMMQALRAEITAWVAEKSPMQDARLSMFGNAQTVRADIASAVFGGIPTASLNQLEQSVLKAAGGNPGAASALQKLSEQPGGVETLSRLLTSAPELAREKVWELFKDQCRENPAVFQAAVTDYLNARGAP